jgi:parallel beta-helix repeat protein
VIDITANNVTISSFTIQNSAKPELHGIHVYCSSGNNISGNIITNNGCGIYTGGSYYTPNFIISNIISNNWMGVCLSDYGYTVLTNNTISHNTRGLTLYSWMGVLPRIFHNNFIDNGIQGYCVAAYALWDDGYPSGGNYWSDHTGKDEKNGPNQDQLGSDGIGDIPYVFDVYNPDNYPFMDPNGWLLHQLTQLTVTSSPITGITFTIDEVPETTPYTAWLLEGSYTLEMPEAHEGYVWSHWLEDGDTNRMKTITLPGTTWTAVYTPPPPVGGKAIPINMPTIKLKLQIPWIWLSTIILLLIVTVFYIKKRKRNTEITS